MWREIVLRGTRQDGKASNVARISVDAQVHHLQISDASADVVEALRNVLEGGLARGELAAAGVQEESTRLTHFWRSVRDWADPDVLPAILSYLDGKVIAGITCSWQLSRLIGTQPEDSASLTEDRTEF